MTAGDLPLVGREDELAALLDAARTGRSAVMVAPAGMGKSAIMRSLRATASVLDSTVLLAHPTEPEQRLAFSGLTDLLADVPVEEYDDLPGPQRTALRAALLLDDARDETDPRAVGAALRGVLAKLAGARPVLILVDDAQWLDDATTTVLAAALRRLRDVRVSVVAAARPTGDHSIGWVGDRHDVVLTPLGKAALFQVIRSHLAITPSRGELLEIERASGGNPLFALELARHHGDLKDPSLDRLIGDRLRSLPRSTRLALLTAALAPDPQVELVAAARERGALELLDDLEPAVRAGVVKVTERVGFGHPLFAHGVTETAAAADVRAAHQRLADGEISAETRAWHLAQATTEPDADLADQLEEAAEEARRRGGWESSVNLLRLALDRTVESERRADRCIVLAKWLAMASDLDEAEQLLERARSFTTGERYWNATLELCDLRYLQGRLRDIAPLADEMRVGDLLPEQRVRFWLDYAVYWPPDCPASDALERIDQGRHLLADLPDTRDAVRLRARALLTEGFTVEYLAHGSAEELYQRGWALALDDPDPAHDGLYWFKGRRLFQEWRYDEARSHFSACLDEADTRGDESGRARWLFMLAAVDLAAGRWDDAQAWARRAGEAGIGQGQNPSDYETTAILVRGFRGDLTGTEQSLCAMMDNDRREGNLQELAVHRGMLAGVLLAHGRIEQAYEVLLAAREVLDEIECFDPTFLPVDDNLLIAMIQTGRYPAARKHLTLVRERTRRLGRPEQTLAVLDLIIRAGEGDLDGAVIGLPPVLAQHDACCPNPVTVAIAHLLAGRVFRRARQKRLAAASLTKAIEVFDSLPCPPYAEQVRAELARVGLRPRASEELTETEHLVATLASQGLRNREIAQQAFVSPKTVEAVLSRAYRKLGIRSRAEIGRALEELETDA